MRSRRGRPWRAILRVNGQAIGIANLGRSRRRPKLPTSIRFEPLNPGETIEIVMMASLIEVRIDPYPIYVT